jgi:hypothetical protein
MNTPQPSEAAVRLLPCPFCNAQPQDHDGDLLVNHSVACFFTRQHAQEMWLVGSRKQDWNTRPQSEALRLAKEALGYVKGTDILADVQHLDVGETGGPCAANCAFTARLLIDNALAAIAELEGKV